MSEEDTVIEPDVGATSEVPKVDGGTTQFQASFELSRRKRAKKRDATKIRHHLEKLLSAPSVDKQEIEHRVEQLWVALEEAQAVLDDLAECYLQQKDYNSQKVLLKESGDLEMECNKVIEKAQAALIAEISATGNNQAKQNDNTAGTSTAQGTGSSENPSLTADNMVDTSGGANRFS